MPRKVYIGSVMIHATGSNPYVYSRDNFNKSGPHAMDGRIKTLRKFRDNGTLPDGFSLWDDSNREPITSPDQIDWTHMRD